MRTRGLNGIRLAPEVDLRITLLQTSTFSEKMSHTAGILLKKHLLDTLGRYETTLGAIFKASCKKCEHEV